MIWILWIEIVAVPHIEIELHPVDDIIPIATGRPG